MGAVEEEQIKQAQNLPKDEFGITHTNILYNRQENRVFCILEAPSKEAIQKHHQKFGDELRLDFRSKDDSLVFLSLFLYSVQPSTHQSVRFHVIL